MQLYEFLNNGHSQKYEINFKLYISQLLCQKSEAQGQ
jgi:hypothetical protein